MSRGRFFVAGIVSMMIAGLIPWSSPAAESTASAEKVAKEARETIEATREYTAQQKEAFQRKAHEELVAIQRQIIGLREKITAASETTRAELQKSLDELEKKKDGVKEKVDELKSTTDAKWHDVREGMNTALNDLKRSYQKLLSRMP
jgi:flagellar biosynthesis GTPase FlhF